MGDLTYFFLADVDGWKFHGRGLESQGIPALPPPLLPQHLLPLVPPPLPTPLLQQAEDRWDPLAVPLAPLLVGNCGQRAPQQMVADEMVGLE